MVEVTGQAYFKVTHNTHQPFSVMVKGQTIEDLGTEFNINAYDNEPFVSTTLLEGSIRLDYLKERKVLRPGQQARTRTGIKGIGISVADTEEVTAWKNGYFRFNDEELESVMRKIARWYNVEVTYKEPITGAAFSGKISRYKNIGQVLKVLSATQAVHFKIEGRRIMVSR
jgi:ferric-dicitrate binding protein FerR (iron transport regulator)